jgi:hypothetical protein
MADYNVTLYLTGGATANAKLTAGSDEGAVHMLETELARPICVLKDRKEGMILTVKTPAANVIAYSVDRLGT